jgi:ATP-binding cassette subfamily B protein
MEALERLSSGRTTFMITHDVRLAARADVILYLDSGRVREWASHGELVQAGGPYAALVRLQTSDLIRERPVHPDAVTA